MVNRGNTTVADSDHSSPRLQRRGESDISSESSHAGQSERRLEEHNKGPLVVENATEAQARGSSNAQSAGFASNGEQSSLMRRGNGSETWSKDADDENSGKNEGSGNSPGNGGSAESRYTD